MRTHRDTLSLPTFILWHAMLLLPSLAFGQPGNLADDLERELDRLNREVTANSSLAKDPARLKEILGTRSALLTKLIESSPVKAVELALPAEAAARLRGLAPQAPIETSGEWEGSIVALAADDFANHRSWTEWYLQTETGRLKMYSADSAAHRPGASVRVHGVQLGDRIAADRVLSARAVSGDYSGCATAGPMNFAVLMITTPSERNFPRAYTKAALRQAFFGSDSDTRSTDSLNGYLKEMSYGRAFAKGDVFGPFALDQDYRPEDEPEFMDAAIQAAASTVDFTKFNRVALFFPSSTWTVSAYSYIGCVWLGTWRDKGLVIGSVTYVPLPQNAPDPDPALYFHEFGHALGLGDSNTADYGNVPLGPLQDLGFSPGLRADWFSSMGDHTGHFPAPFKALYLDWLRPPEYQDVQSSGSFALAPIEVRTGLRALRILRDASIDSWLWVEYRQPIGDIDSTFLNYSPRPNVFDGALVHYERYSEFDPSSNLLTFNPVAYPNNFYNAALEPGSSWADPYSLLRLSVGSRTPAGLSVSVTYDQPCAMLQLSSSMFDVEGGSGTVTVTAPPWCQWSASTATPGITLTGVTSGSGNGLVSFTVAPNGYSQSLGFITIQRQSLRISQAGRGPVVLGVSPQNGVGKFGQFTIQLADPLGDSEIKSVYFFDLFCPIIFDIKNSRVWLAGRPGFDPPAPVGGISKNSVCAMYSDGTSITHVGNLLTLTVRLEFFPTFAGTHHFSVEVDAARGTYNRGGYGLWTVPPGPECINITAPSMIGSAAQDIPITINEMCVPLRGWTVWSTDSWLTLPWEGFSNGGKYTFSAHVRANISGADRVAIISDGSVTATITQRYTPNLFSDVPPANEFSNAINEMRLRAITDGCRANPPAYCPEDAVTRGQMAVFVVRSIMGGDDFSYQATPYFTDVPKEHSFFKWVQKMKELGITSGCHATEYCPDLAVTRAQMAVFIIRARFGSTATITYPSPPFFDDVPATHEFFRWIQKMKQVGITSGCTAVKYCPESAVTRGQMAMFVLRGAFNRFLPVRTPIIESISPADVTAGQVVDLVIKGKDTHFTQDTTRRVSIALRHSHLEFTDFLLLSVC